jgi:hypothetical protein
MVRLSYPILHTNAEPSVPLTPGVYALENEITGAIYIGCATNLRNRYRGWHAKRRHTEARLRYYCADRLARELATAPMEGWRFVVLVTSKDMSEDERYALEARAIERAVEGKGRRCLNTQYGGPRGAGAMIY